MAHVISSLTPDNSTDASFRAWGLGISTALKSLFTFVTQTGEINWSTVTTPSFGGDIRGFEIYRLNDSLQSTTPIFIKIQYGSGSHGLQLPACRGRACRRECAPPRSARCFRPRNTRWASTMESCRRCSGRRPHPAAPSPPHRLRAGQRP